MANSEDLGNVYGDQKPTPPQQPRTLGNVHDDQSPTLPQQPLALDNVYGNQGATPPQHPKNLGNVNQPAGQGPSPSVIALQEFTDALNALKTRVASDKRNDALEEVIKEAARSLATKQEYDQLNDLTQSLRRVTRQNE